ncbi:MAG TPA: TonB-dependent receptor [Albitalea sp.]|uniref:TonB-dependent receptor n=1 Tax=Piscinibacter sp. TaxID=1903157 RepID=UPI002ED58B30
MRNPLHACRRHAVAAATAAAFSPALHAQDVLVATHATGALDRVNITGSRPSTLPIEIPTSTESITGAAVEDSINATDAEDALKYFPSLLVRKRYIGDFDHAVLASRASGTGNSARSLVYADGMLLSNLLGNGATFTPRWALVTPEQIERIDVLYGPFSAAYPGNSAGAIVDYLTRMPREFEAHAKLGAQTQRYALYGTDERFSGGQGSVSLGSRQGSWSWWVDLNRLASDAQPIGFVNKTVPAAPGSSGTPVTGAVVDANPRNQPWVLFGATGQTHTLQDHAKLKLAYDFSPTLRASYTLGIWRNDADRDVQSFLRDAGGAPVQPTTATVNVDVDGHDYALTPADFARTRNRQEHVAQGVALKSNTRGTWDWEIAASHYDYRRDEQRTEAVRVGTRFPGALTDLHGTGWTTLSVRGTWRPADSHTVEAGVQRDAFRLRTLTSETAQWSAGTPGARIAAAAGDTTLTSLWAQDSWRFAPQWRSVLGLRAEQWRAFNGSVSNATADHAFDTRREQHLSPKAALSFEAGADWTFKASAGRAVRMPTVSELFQGALVGNDVPAFDPTLKPETSWTTELSAERTLPEGLLRATLFFERTADALYSQPSAVAGGNTVQNVDKIRTHGIELAGRADNVGIRGLDLSGGLTYADSKIVKNDKNPASVGARQPRVPLWRVSLLAAWRVDEHWSTSLGARYSGRQYGQLDNSDSNDFAYTGFSRFFVADLRVRYRIDKQWSAAVGIDNLGNKRYRAFHPYPQRTFNAELKFDL